MLKVKEKKLGEVKITVPGCRCRCGHEWIPKRWRIGERPLVCPECKSPRWDKPYKYRDVDRKRSS